MSFRFKSEEDPVTKNAINLEFTKLDFEEATGEAAETVIKFAAMKKIQETKDKAAQIALSLKYQVLCDHTAMIGVVK